MENKVNESITALETETAAATPEETPAETAAATPEETPAEAAATPEETPTDAVAAAPEETPVEAPAKKKGKGGVIAVIIACALILLAAGGLGGVYFTAQNRCGSGDYDSAKAMAAPFEFIPPFAVLADECDYMKAGEIADSGDLLQAYEIYSSIAEHKDAGAKANEVYYSYGQQLFEEGLYENAAAVFAELGEYSDAAVMMNESNYRKAMALLEAGQYDEAKEQFAALGDYEDAEKYVNESDYRKAAALFEVGDYDGAQSIYESLGDYEDSKDNVINCEVYKGIELYRSGDYDAAMVVFEKYYEENDAADVYYTICLLPEWEAEGYLTVGLLDSLFTAFEPYADDFDDVAELLASPMFFISRFFGAGWVCGEDIYLDADFEDLTIYHSDLPWERPDGSLWYSYDESALYFYADEEVWFAITGFDSYDTRYPDKMYVTGSDGVNYEFKCYDIF